VRFVSDRRTFLGGGGAAALLAAAPVSAHVGVSPKDFGAIGNGSANDLAAVLKAVAHALANGLPVDGGDLLYGIAGTVTISNRVRPHISSLRLKQLAPKQAQNTIEFHGCQQIRIDSLYVHTGDAKRVGQMSDTFGLRIRGGTGHRLRNVEATGNGKVTYIQIWETADSVLENAYVHDGAFEDFEMHPAGTNHPPFRVPDDVVQAIHLADNTGLSLLNPVVRNMLGNATYMNLDNVAVHFPNLRTRGICGGGNTDTTIINPKVTNTDQAIDLSGNGGNWGNKNTQIIGGHTRDCGSVGIKFSGAQSRNKVVGHIVENCGMMGFLIGGYDSNFRSFDNEIVGCTVINPGYNQINSDTDADPLSHCGYLLFEELSGGLKGTRISDCRAIDRQGFYLEGDDEASWPLAGATSANMQYAWTAIPAPIRRHSTPAITPNPVTRCEGAKAGPSR
jgi:hypothetical protein